MKKIRISKKVFSVIFTGVLVVLSVISGYLLFTNSFDFDGINFTIRKPKVYEAKMFMVGDALIHQSVYYNAGQNGNGYDFKPMIELIKPISSSYDLAYYNQETILGGTSLGLSHYPRFNSPQEVGDAMIDAGFNVVSLATNHTMDKGEAGVLASVNYWNSKKDVVTSGQWSSYEERDKVRVYEKNI